MPQASGGGRSEGEAVPSGNEELSEGSPLELIRGQIVPPVPNRWESAIDWLHDFGGFSWIAYGASSLLVISHYPSPTSREKTLIEPLLKQVIEPSLRLPSGAAAGDGSPVMKAVAWCHSQPSGGVVAAGLGDSVFVYYPDFPYGRASLCWRQIAVLVHSFSVEAIEWTKSGDGLIVVGNGVVSWKKEDSSWKMSWKSQFSVAQTLVSTTWSTNDPVATVAHHSAYSCFTEKSERSPPSQEISQKVFVFFGEGGSQVVKVELYHTQPVSMIQWRPLSKKDFTRSRRNVLLTCCLDGAVRLWSEIDSGRSQKCSKDVSQQKSTRQSFHVIAVIEINHCLKGVIGQDIFVSWATEIWGTFSNSEGSEQCFSSNYPQDDHVGRCDWLVSVGPEFSVSFWSVHCLDDLLPLRFPRVSFWRKHNLMDYRAENLSNVKNLQAEGEPLLIKAIVWRNCLSGPPDGCSLLQLLPDNLVSWSRFSTPFSATTVGGSLSEVTKDEILSHYAGGFLSADSHVGRILRVAIHPCSCELEIAVSLDSNGFLLFWSFSTTDCASGLNMIPNTVCQFIGKISTRDISNANGYLTLNWAPSVIYNNRFLLLGGPEGIDCILIKLPGEERKKILHQKLFTISFSDFSGRCGPDYVTAVPLSSTCEWPFTLDCFMVVAAWMKEFRVLAWKIVLQSDDGDQSTSTPGRFSYDLYLSKSSGWKYECYFGGKRYLVSVDLCAMQFSDSHGCDRVTCFAVLSPDKSYTCTKQVGTSSKHIHRTSSLYHIVTGHSDGTVRLWRSASLKSLDHHSDEMCLPWELVGMFSAHCKPVSLIALSSCGTKIATACKEPSNEISGVRIWQFMSLLGGGGFLLEGRVPLRRNIVSLKWRTLGNGHSILAVCLPNGLCLYSPKRSRDPEFVKSGKPANTPKWVCIANCHTYSTAQDFVWGPGLSLLLVHERHLSVFGQWSVRRNRNGQPKLHGHPGVENSGSPAANVHETSVEFPYAIVNDTGIPIVEGLLTAENSEAHGSLVTELGTVFEVNKFDEFMSFLNDVSCTRSEFSSTAKVADEHCSSLPTYHPHVLLIHLFSGNWKRAYGIVRHLVRCLNSSDCTSLNSGIFVPEIHLSEYFGEKYGAVSRNEGFQWGYDISREASSMQGLLPIQYHSLENFPENKSSSTSQGPEFMGFIDTLQKSDDVRARMGIDSTKLLAIVDLLGEIVDPQNTSVYESFDKPGRRFWVSVRFQRLHFLRKVGRSATAEEMMVDSSVLAWAFQSDCQDSLISSLLSAESSWMEMQSIGVGFWFTNAAQLRSRMEKLARFQYLMKKDPKDCALLYIALNRLQVLAGLFKLRKDEKDKALVGFLSRNFQVFSGCLEECLCFDGKASDRTCYCFFLAGGDASSAVTVCAKNLGNEQLALVICRLIQGYGGPLEHQLIVNVLLPNAVEKRDFWLASMLEWSLGNFSNSFKRMLALDASVENDSLDISSTTFSDTNISEYLVMLSTKNGMRNAVGDYLFAVLSNWATSMNIVAFFRSGLPLEALECISSSSTSESKNQLYILSTERDRNSSGINPFSSNEHNSKLNTAMQYILKLVMEHPSWTEDDQMLFRDSNQLLLEKYYRDINFAVSKFAGRYSLDTADIMNMILVSADNHMLLSLGYHIQHGNIFQESVEDKTHMMDTFPGYAVLLLRLGKSIEEACLFLGRYVSTLSFIGSVSILDMRPGYSKVINDQCHSENLSLRNIIKSVRGFRPLLSQYSRVMPEDYIPKTFDLKLLISLTLPVVNSLKSGKSFIEATGSNILEFLCQSSVSAFQITANNNLEGITIQGEHEECESKTCIMSQDEQWHLISVSLWRQLSAFFKQELRLLNFGRLEDEATASEVMKTFPSFSANLLISSLNFISSSLTRCLRSFLVQKVKGEFTVGTLIWLQEYKKSGNSLSFQHLNQKSSTLQLTHDSDEKSLLRMLWVMAVDPKEIQACFTDEEINDFFAGSQKQNGSWNDIHECIISEYSNGVNTNEDVGGSVTSNDEPKSRSEARRSILEDQRKKPTCSREVTNFHSPREVYKRNGELLEAICFNSTDERQVALASNRKVNLIRWAGSESTPIPTFVSPGVGLGSRKGAHLGLGGATIGVGALARPGRDLTGFGAFGVPGYAGIAASGLGWENRRILRSSRILQQHHPSKPLFLVGSSNTHVYLWEFGKDRATATYGVLPAANVPPPYALASISAVQFDLCGHRFATVALDGTVCTWQLEVGGRSNVRPTDSSLCFNKHASAIAYVAASGSILAAAGHSSTNANVVIWDTLAPPIASQAFLTCHEGGARSLSVFDNDIGIGSMSPLILTGGKNGDVGLHDFRYIATGKSKRHRHSAEQNIKNKFHENVNGMIWHIPSAHQGSVTKIVTIPHTSLVLTGSKDGDVKLWDARRCQMIFHWQKMHERHTFLQPSSRGFGGIARAAVTDIQVLSNGFLTCGGDAYTHVHHLPRKIFTQEQEGNFQPDDFLHRSLNCGKPGAVTKLRGLVISLGSSSVGSKL
ncbi:unnamed protein product [Spirodela intermedia]|uniref:RAVE complex protein Rav1 C-terminal domain-containing protein n=1 Tax=Spirodela intermedia TaxID=51605 RepID=A0A7I8J8J1_SPIIN|nr:unnamed protein product [Spirodela intermedia]CAA6665762.1 unnamed protein product [Spirodela intermedia]